METEMLNEKAQTRHLEGLGKSYGLDWLTGGDGECHLGVDGEVALLAGYRHGRDWRKGRVRSGEVGTWEV